MNTYNVVHKTIIEGTCYGTMTWTSYESKEHYDKWNDTKMQSWYETVAEGVTSEEAIAMCSTPEASDVAMMAYASRMSEIFNICSSIPEVDDEAAVAHAKQISELFDAL